MNKKTVITEQNLKVSAVLLAKILDVSKQRISQYVHDGMPKDYSHAFDLATCVKWRLERSEERSRESSLNPHKKKEIAARTNKIEIDIQLKKGNLIRVDDAKPLFEAFAVQFVNELQTIPGRISASNEIKAVITEECRDAALRLSDYAIRQATSLTKKGEFLEEDEVNN